jgi:hypothetical protein
VPGEHFEPKIEILSNKVEDDDIMINNADNGMLSPVHLTESEGHSRRTILSEQHPKINQSH